MRRVGERGVRPSLDRGHDQRRMGLDPTQAAIGAARIRMESVCWKQVLNAMTA
jgi:hypothetical protein